MEQQEVNYCNHIPSSLAAAGCFSSRYSEATAWFVLNNLEYPNNYYYINTLKVLLWLLKLKIFPSNKRKIKFICQWRILFSESGLPSLWSDDWCVGAGSNTERGDQTARHWTLWSVDTVDTGPVNGTKFHSEQLLVLSQLRIYAKWTQHRHEIKIVLKDHNQLAKTRVLKIIVPTVHPFLSHFTVRSAFRITLYLNSPLLCLNTKCCCHLYWPPITGNMTAVTLALLISPDTARCEDKED